MGITYTCFGLSYVTALALELFQTGRPSRSARWIGLIFAIGGLFAHTVFLVTHRPNPSTPYGSVLLLAWVFAVFYLYGAVHRPPRPWALFVLPLVLILTALSLTFLGKGASFADGFSGRRFWGIVHGLLVLAAAVGITLGFLASLMYLVQSRRLRLKRVPLGGLRLGSLERLETMNRRAVTAAFPFLTVGLLLGVIRAPLGDGAGGEWTELKILSTAGLWLAALVLLYLRYGAHLPPRRLAILTIAVFGLLMAALLTAHPFAGVEGSR